MERKLREVESEAERRERDERSRVERERAAKIRDLEREVRWAG